MLNKFIDLEPELSRRKKVQCYAGYCVDHAQEFRHFENADEFATVHEADKETPFGYNLRRLREAITEAIWKKGVFLAPSEVDNLLFQELVHSGSNDPIGSVLARLDTLHLNSPGLLVYPTHSLGVSNCGILASGRTGATNASFVASTFVVYPQAHSIATAISNIVSGAANLGINASLPSQRIQHWFNSRDTDWLERNPLLLVRTNVCAFNAFEVQNLLLMKLKLATSHVFFLASMQPEDATDATNLTSSAIVNAQHTLDISHYLLFMPSPHSSNILEGHCNPINFRRFGLAELAEVPVTLDSNHWKTNAAVAGRICAAISLYESYFLTAKIENNASSALRHAVEKMWDALKFFRRSFRRVEDFEEEVVNLAVAFEVLLMDSYATPTEKHVVRRVQAALQNEQDAEQLVSALAGLYNTRNEYLHGGRANANLDVHRIRQAFVLVFLVLTERLHQLPRRSSTPIADLLGLQRRASKKLCLPIRLCGWMLKRWERRRP